MALDLPGRPAHPRVSVVMAVYNGCHWLPEALDCVLSQTMRDFELVVVDDGSTDDSQDLVRAAAQKDPRVVLLPLGKNRGLTLALRAGIDEARGEYIARQDVDDFSAPHRLERCLALAAPKRLLLSRWLISNEQGAIKESLSSKILGFLPVGIAMRAERYLNLAAHGSFFFSKAQYLAIGGYREYFRLAQDYDLILRWAENGEVRIIPEALYTVRQHSSSLGATKASQQYNFARDASYFAWQRRSLGREEPLEKEHISGLHQVLFRLANRRRYGVLEE